MPVKVEKSNYTGVQRCTSKNSKPYYRGRVYLDGREYYTDKCSIAKEAVKLRELLKSELQEKKTANQPIEALKLKSSFLVKDVLKQYYDVMSMLKPGGTFSLSTIYERKRHMKNMIDDTYYCCIRDIPVKDLTNAHLLKFKTNYYMIRNRDGMRYDIDTIRSYVNSFKGAFSDCAMKNEAVARKIAELDWNILKTSRKEQNSPTQLLILDNEKNSIDNTITIGEETIRIAGKNRKTVKRVRKNDSDHWDTDNYKRFIENVWKPLSDQMNEMIGSRKCSIRGSDYEQATIDAVMYETGMRFGEIRAMCKDNFYRKEGVSFYFLEHAIPQRVRLCPDECMKDDELWNNVSSFLHDLS